MMENFYNCITLPTLGEIGLAHTGPALPIQVNAGPQTLVTQPTVVVQPAQPTVAPVALLLFLYLTLLTQDRFRYLTLLTQDRNRSNSINQLITKLMDNTVQLPHSDQFK